MSAPDKVVVEITGDRYVTTVYSGETIVARRGCKMESSSSSRGEQPGDFQDDFEDDGDFADSLDEIQSAAFDVASELRNFQ